MKYLHLELRLGESSRQMFLKGTRKKASTVYKSMRAEGHSIAEAADNHFISPAAVKECIRYCKANESLILKEEEEVERYLREHNLISAH